MIAVLLTTVMAMGPTSGSDFLGTTDDKQFTVTSHYESNHAATSRRGTPQQPSTYTSTNLACELSRPGALVCQEPDVALQEFCAAPSIAAPYLLNVYRTEDDEQLSSEIVALPCNPESPAPTPSAAPFSVSQRDFQSLKLTASKMVITPDSGDLYVNLPIFMNTSAEPQTLTTELLGTPVRIRATPKEFAWDYGDDATKSGSTPGATYPDETYAHNYKTPGTYTVTLTTTWTGEFSIDNGTTWTTIEGTAQTISTSRPLNVEESIPVLTK